MVLTLWLILFALLALFLALDLGVFHRGVRAQTAGEALGWSLVWISAALLFNGFVFFAYNDQWFGIGREVGHELDGAEAAVQFFTAYVVEKSLSIDNIFVIAMIFTYFSIPLQNQHRVLYWGVVGALVMRAVLIVSGLALIERFAWTTYVFGLILLGTSVKLLVDRHDNLQPEKNVLVRVLQRRMRITDEFRGGAFFVRDAEGWSATRLFVALVVVECSDLLFAVDSIPAVMAVTQDPFLAFSSNAFAILGLRSLYFVVAPLIARFRYLKMSLIFILAFIGIKLLLMHFYPIPVGVSLAFILGILGVGIAASWVGSGRDTVLIPSPVEENLDDLIGVTVRGARRIVVGVVGATILLTGIVMLLLPGPGLIAILIGLTVLSTEFLWAKRWLARVRETAAAHNPLRSGSRPPPEGPPKPPVVS
jgi:tellurite resistance protein TerC